MQREELGGARGSASPSHQSDPPCVFSEQQGTGSALDTLSRCLVTIGRCFVSGRRACERDQRALGGAGRFSATVPGTTGSVSWRVRQSLLP